VGFPCYEIQHQPVESTVDVDSTLEDEESLDHYDQPCEDELSALLSNDLSVPYIPAVNSETTAETELEKGCQNQPLPTAGENETNEESEWVLDYLDRIQDVLQDEMVHAEKEMEEHDDDDELWYDAFQEPDSTDVPNNRENTESANVYTDAESEDLDHKPLYENCPLTVGLSALLIITFAMRHLLSGKALHDLLGLISLHCRTPNYCFKSLFKFKKHFQHLKSPLKFHKYCARCAVAIDDQTKTCPNALCQQDLTVTGNVSFFIEVPMEKQIASMFGTPGMWDLLKFRFTRIKKGSKNLEDIYDGNQYQKYLKNGGILSDQRNISFTWNTDGIPVFKSSKLAIWPLYCIVNELPYAQRIRRSNMIFAGLWFGSTKPNMLTYFKPFHSSLRILETEGIDVESPEAGPFTSRAVLLAGSCDLPAKCLVCNTRFNSIDFTVAQSANNLVNQYEPIKVEQCSAFHSAKKTQRALNILIKAQLKMPSKLC
jgi:hypothetical protein